MVRRRIRSARRYRRIFFETFEPRTLLTVALTRLTPDAAVSGHGPYAITQGDFNRDGILDLATANITDASVSILLGNGQGGFVAGPGGGRYAARTTTGDIAAGDVNNDGKLDLVTANTSDNSVSALLGNGDGTFRTAQNFATGHAPEGLALADFNGDGRLDIATANYADHNITSLLGNGDGTFQAAQGYFAGAGGPIDVTTADLNRDGKLDLIVSEFTADVPGVWVSVLTGVGNGSFQLYQAFGTGRDPVHSAVGDFNEDGWPDIVTANESDNSVSVLLATGSFWFNPRTDYSVGTRPDGVEVGDIDHDGHLDIVSANRTAGTVSILLGHGDGTFSSRVDLSSGSGANRVIATDLNGDGSLDLATANIFADTIAVLLNTGDPANPHLSIGVPANATVGTPFSVTVTARDSGNNVATGFTGAVHFASSDRFAGLPADYTFTAGDAGAKTFSVTISSPGSQTVSASLVGNSGIFAGAAVNAVISPVSFASAGNLSAGSRPMVTAAADFNRDGILDFAAATWNTKDVRVWLGNGDGNFRSTGTTYGLADVGVYDLIAADLNGDGLMDLTTANSRTNNVSVFPGNGDGTFGSRRDLAAGDGTQSVKAIDLDNDGDMDLVTANVNAGTLSILRNNGNWSFSTLQTPSSGGSLSGDVTISDFNADGRPDLAVTNWTSGSVGVLLQNTAGTFASAVTYSVGGNPSEIENADFDRDGKLDLIVANYATGQVHWLRGNGAGQFTVGGSTFVAAGTQVVTVGDYNGDGISDLATSASNGTGVNILAGRGDGTFGVPTFFSTGLAVYRVTSADLDGNGTKDLLVANQDANTVSVLMNAGAPANPHLSISVLANSPFNTTYTVTVTALSSSNSVLTGFVGTVHFASSDSLATLPADYVFQPADNGTKTVSITQRTAGNQTISATLVGSNGIFSGALVNTLQPVAWYRAEGNANDSVGSNNGVLQSGGTYTAGMLGQAFNFNGSSAVNISKVNSVLNPGSGNFTIAGWINAASTQGFNGFHQIFGQYGGVQLYDIGLTPQGKLYFEARDGSNNYVIVTGLATLTDNQWHHVAGVRQGSSFSIYVDGILAGTQTNTAVGAINPPTNYARMGGTNTGPDPDHLVSPVSDEALYTGKIDELGYYQRALTTLEIQALAAVTNTAPTANAGGPYIVNPGSTVTLDASGSTDLEQPATGLSYSWDLNNDGAFGDATGVSPTFDATNVTQSQTLPISVRATDSNGLSSTAATTIFVPAANSAQTPQPLTSDLLLNSDRTGSDQLYPSVAAITPSGEFVGVWEDAAMDGNLEAIAARRFTVDGTPIGNTFQVNQITPFSQVRPDIASSGTGKYVVVWQTKPDSGTWKIDYRLYQTDGTPLTGELRVPTQSIHQSVSRVAMRSDASFVIGWSASPDGDTNNGVYLQQFNADGTTRGGTVLVSDANGLNQWYEDLAFDNNGNLVVTWESNGQDGSGFGVYARRYDSNLAPLGSEFRVNTTTVNDQRTPKIAVRGDGSFIITWTSQSQDGSGLGVYAQRYDANANKLGGEFRVNNFTTNDQGSPAISAYTIDGRFLVYWWSLTEDGSGYGTYARLFNADGSARGNEFRVNQSYVSDQIVGYSSPVAFLPLAGKAAFAWFGSVTGDTSGYGIGGRIFDTVTTQPVIDSLKVLNPRYDATPALTHWWTGDVAGDAADSAGYANGILEGASAGVPIDGRKAFQFNGSSDIAFNNISDLDFAANSNFVFEAWIKTLSAGQSILSVNYACTAETQSLGMDGSGRAYFSVRGSSDVGYTAYSVGSVNNGQWHHLVGVREVDPASNTNKVSLYVDGLFAASQNVTGALGSLARGAVDYIGRNFPCGSSGYFNGLIDEVRTYNRALTSIQAEARFNNADVVVDRGSTVNLLATAVDANAPASALSYAWDFGDGSTDSGPGVTNQTAHTYQTVGAKTVRVTVTDADGNAAVKTLVVYVVQGPNSSPTAITLSSSSVPENQPTGAVVGTLSSSDPNVGDTFTYSLVNGAAGADNASFTIVGNELRTATAFNFEAKSPSTYNILVRTTDNGGLTFDQAFVITVTNVNEAPSGSSGSVGTLEDVAYTFKTTDFGFTDLADNPNPNSLQAVKITTLPTAGTITLFNGVNDFAVSLGQLVTASDINANKLKFKPSANGSGNAATTSAFGAGAEGWSVISFTDPAANDYSLFPNSTDYPVSYHSTGGNSGGYIDVQDPDSGYFMFRAPGTFLSDKSWTTGLSYDLTHPVGSPINFQTTDVMLVSGTTKLLWQSSPAIVPTSGWTSVTLSFVPSANWHLNTTNGPLATPADFRNVLGNLTALYIRGEYTIGGDEYSGIDNVRLTSASNGLPYATFTFQVQDGGGTASGGIDTDPTPKLMTVNVTPVNDAPSFTKGADQYALHGPGAQSISSWATNISAGPTDEAAQAVTFIVSNDNAALFSVPPAISSSGALTYTAAPNVTGTAHVTVTLKDDGGTVNGGVDASQEQTFAITVFAVNPRSVLTETTADTFITDAAGVGGPNSTHDQETVLVSIKYFNPGGGGSLATRPMFKFDLTPFAGAIVTQPVKFRAYLMGPSDSPPYWHPESRQVDLFQITSPWNSPTVTWNTQPSISYLDTKFIQYLGPANNGYVEWTVPQAVAQGWIDNPSSNNGLMIVNQLPDAFFFDLYFASLENPTYPAAQLVLQAANVPNQPPTGSPGGPYALTYGDGVSLDASRSFDPDGDSLSYSWTINGYANAAAGVHPTVSWTTLAGFNLSGGNSYPISVVVDDGHGHVVTSGGTMLTVNRANSSVTVDCSLANETYNGSAHTPCTATVTGAGGLSQSLAVSYLDNVNAGTATASASFTGDANHSGSSGSATFDIAKADATVVVTPYSVTYDGQPHTASYTITGVNGENGATVGTINVSGTTHTAAGTYNGDVWSFAGAANYNNASGTVNDSIAKASSSVTVDCSLANETYNGSAHTPCTATVTGAGGLSQSLAVSYLDNVNAGTATASASFTGDANHSGSSGSATFDIAKAIQSITWSNPASISYGTPLSNTQLNATVAGVSGGSAPGALSYSPVAGTVLPAGNQTLSVIAAATTNYNTASTTVILIVLPAQPTINLLIDQVNALVSSAVLNSGNGNALLVKLQATITSLNAGNTVGAVNQMGAFINQVNAFVKSGKLTAAQAQPLIDAANQVIAAASGSGVALVIDAPSNPATTDTLPASRVGQLVSGTIGVYLDDGGRNITENAQARFGDALATLNTSVGKYGFTLVDVGTANAASAVIRVHIASTSAAGSAADGVLGCTVPGEITLVTGWNWYTGSNPADIAQGQYDLQTIVTHELAHAIGLGHSGDIGSVMFAYLGAAQTRREVTAQDLTLVQLDFDDGHAEPLLALGYGDAQRGDDSPNQFNTPVIFEDSQSLCFAWHDTSVVSMAGTVTDSGASNDGKLLVFAKQNRPDRATILTSALQEMGLTQENGLQSKNLISKSAAKDEVVEDSVDEVFARYVDLLFDLELR